MSNDTTFTVAASDRQEGTVGDSTHLQFLVHFALAARGYQEGTVGDSMVPSVSSCHQMRTSRPLVPDNMCDEPGVGGTQAPDDADATGDAPRAVSPEEQPPLQSILGSLLQGYAVDLQDRYAVDLQGTPMSPDAVVEMLRRTSGTLNGDLLPADTNAVGMLLTGIGTLLGLNPQQIADFAEKLGTTAAQNLIPQEPAGSATVGPPQKPMEGFVCAPQPLWDGLLNVHNTEYQTTHKVPQPDGSYKRPKITRKILGGDHLTRFKTGLQAGVTQVPARSVITDTRIRVVQDKNDKSIWLWFFPGASAESLREATGVQQISHHFGEMLKHRRSTSSCGWVAYTCDTYPGGSERLGIMSEF